MANPVILSLELRDVYGDLLKEKVDIILRHQVLSQVVKVSNNASTKIDIKGLNGAPQGLYRIDVDPPSYQYVSQFINLKASGATTLELTFPIDPGKVKKVKFPVFGNTVDDLQKLLENSEKVVGFEGKKGKALYDGLDDIRRAGLLNIAAKTRATLLTNERSVLSYIQELRIIRGDRFFAIIPRELREETKNSVADGLFHPADSSLHDPPTGFKRAGSFKTPDHYGNLQLTFFTNNNGDYMADIDIDDAAGIEHVFQVLKNKFSGSPTHPYNIHEILVGYQHNDPGYSFQI